MSFLSNYSEGQKNFGLLLLRIGIGEMMITHGYPKLTAGPEMWEKIGGAMKYLHIEFFPVAWGFLAAVAEAGGGLLLIVGILFRPACFFLLIVMAVAVTMHLSKGDGVQVASHAIELGVVFLSLLFIGPGNYRLGKIVIE